MHAVQEAMRGHQIESQVVEEGYLLQSSICELCNIVKEEQEEEIREEGMMNWYIKQRRTWNTWNPEDVGERFSDEGL